MNSEDQGTRDGGPPSKDGENDAALEAFVESLCGDLPELGVDAMVRVEQQMGAELDAAHPPAVRSPRSRLIGLWRVAALLGLSALLAAAALYIVNSRDDGATPAPSPGPVAGQRVFDEFIVIVESEAPATSPAPDAQPIVSVHEYNALIGAEHITKR